MTPVALLSVASTHVTHFGSPAWRRLAGATLALALLASVGGPAAAVAGPPATTSAQAATTRALYASWTASDDPRLQISSATRTLTLTLPPEVAGMSLPQGLEGRATSPEIIAKHGTFWIPLWFPAFTHQVVIDVPDLLWRLEGSGVTSQAVLHIGTRVPDVGVADDVSLSVTLDVVDGGPVDVAVDLTLDTAGHAAGLDPVADYVTAVYADLFGRRPEPEGLAAWTRALHAGAPYGAVADGITYSAEFRSGLISDAYAQYLGRGPDPAGVAAWLDAMSRGMHIQHMEAGFLASAEYHARAGGTDEAWVRALYRDVLGREASDADVRTWVAQARLSGAHAVARGLLYSDEHLAEVLTGYYLWLLGRDIDAVGLRAWTVAIQAGHRTEKIIAGILASGEYRAGVAVG